MKKYLLFALLLLAMIMTLVACGSDETISDADVQNPTTNQIEVEVSDDSVKPDDTEEPVKSDDAEKPVKPDDTEEPVGPDNTDEPVIEMVDWETWATQADNDEVCMVVWNEKTGTQKILQPTTDEKPFIYNVEEGDRFAVPKRDNIMSVSVGFEENFYWQSAEQKYMELEIPVGEKKVIYIACENEEWARSYLFNF